MGAGNGNIIKGVIRHRTTQEYYAGGGRWTNIAGDAMSFHSLTSVVAEAQKHGIRDCCEFMLSLPGRPGFTIALPL
jgi:hypothetical protein